MTAMAVSRALLGKRRALSVIASLAGLAWPLAGRAAPAETVLYNFAGGTDGAYSYARLTMDKNGALYGTTSAGGTAGLGVVFKLTPPASSGAAWTESVLYSFGAGTDGNTPLGAVIINGAGVLFGTTYNGGASNAGTVFALSPPTGSRTAWKEKILYNFTGGADGGNPLARLTFGANGVLYGTASSGGVAGVNANAQGNGVVFSLTPPATGETVWTETVLYAFQGAAGTPGDGSVPYAGVIIDKGGALYGTTESGGVPGISANCLYGSGCGVAWKLSPPAGASSSWTETVLWQFGMVAGDGAVPYAGLTFGRGGVLYGVTGDGGSFPPFFGDFNFGTAYRLTPPKTAGAAWTETVIHDFGYDYDFAYPIGDLIIDNDGALYGTASSYGSEIPAGSSGAGGVFKLAPPAAGSTTWTETKLHAFTNDSGDYCLTGCYPEAGLITDSTGALYGTTVEGGTFPQPPYNVSPGVVFKLTQ